jgi:hypothetical protein
MSRMVPLFTSSAGIEHRMVRTEDGGLQFAARGETDPIIERNKAMATHNDGYTQDKTLRRVATIPLIIWLDWLNREGWDAFKPENAKKLCEKLNDSDYQFLRTAPGRLEYSNGRFR